MSVKVTKVSEPTRAMYRLGREYYDGTRLYLRGEIVEFPIGGAPRTAVMVEPLSAAVGLGAAEAED